MGLLAFLLFFIALLLFFIALGLYKYKKLFSQKLLLKCQKLQPHFDRTMLTVVTETDVKTSQH